ncbi:MAG: type IIL restriction-modification enzyme MmeI [Gammaproteobacteria bacterium]
MVFGSMPNDGGHLLLSDSEKTELLAKEPGAEKWVRPFLGADEFINGLTRWCLWLKDIPPEALKRLLLVMAHVEGVRKHRENSKRASTNKLAKTPTLFGEIRQPRTNYLAVPKTSSERRAFIPIGFLTPTTIASTELFTVSDAAPLHFGILSSTMHMAWVHYVCGRLKSDFRYSAQIVYNNFPWPQKLEDKLRSAIEAAAQGVLHARAAHSGATLAQLYNPNTMPPELTKAHAKLDRAVDAGYMPDGGQRTYASDAERVAFLFRRYAELTSLVG